MTYDAKEHSRALAASKKAMELHAMLVFHAEAASNPSVGKAINDAADALDALMYDELTGGVLFVIEEMEQDAGISETIREVRIMQSAYGRR